MEAQREVEKAERHELLCWLVELGATDRETYRMIRAAMWQMFVDNSESRSRCSDKPSNRS